MATPRSPASNPPLALFDLDNTLVDRVDAVKRWAMRFCADHCIDPVTGLAWIIDADNDGYTTRASFFELLIKRFDIGIAASADAIDALVGSYQREIPAFTRTYSDVPRSLALLRDQGWRIGIVTNGHRAQGPKIRATGLHNLVDGWANSGDEGVRKPDPALFDIAAKRCGYTNSSWRDQAWMVGDSAEADIGGARRCGIESIWLHRLREWPLDEFGPTRVAMSVSDAVTMLLEPELHLPSTINY